MSGGSKPNMGASDQPERGAESPSSAAGRRATVVAICMPGDGHVQRLLPVVEGLCARGHTVHVMAHLRSRAKIERTGAHFIDLFTRHPVEAVDPTSRPVPSRWVTFAGMYAEALTEEVAPLAPGLILYDTFTVVGPVIARRLGIPYVNVCAGHAAVPARVRAALRDDPRVATSAECWEAVRRLEEIYGMRGANPFSYVDAMSPYLNLYGEPEEYLSSEDRGAFEPIAFFGSLAPSLRENGQAAVFPPERRGLRIYVSFGTVVWWYFASVAEAALQVISETLSGSGADAVIALGSHPLKADARALLERPNVRVVDYVDQWAALREADLFITHNGLNSTHEAIYHLVPMISYPFFTDQPALARRCHELGLAVPLGDAPQATVESAALLSALKRLHDERALFVSRLTEARSWELRTIADRDDIFDRIIALTRA